MKLEGCRHAGPLAEAHVAALATTRQFLRFELQLGSQPSRELATTLVPTIAVNVVRVWEPTPPTGEQPVEWVLLTTDPIATE